MYGLINKEPVIRTSTGKYINVFDPRPQDICIEDIAHSLSNQCRFGGHLNFFYTVAQHSLFTASICSPKNKLSALMHDASEAYLLDMPSPIKAALPEYKNIEHNLMLAISYRFGFDYPKPEEVTEADELMLKWEWLTFVENKPSSDLIVLSRAEARKSFLEKFSSIKHNKHFINK